MPKIYEAPLLSLKTDPASVAEVILLPKKSEVPFALPAHLKAHAAAKGERGAKVVIHGTTATRVLFGLGALRSFTPQDAVEWGEAAGHFLIQEQLQHAKVVFPKELQDDQHKQIVTNFIKGLSLANYRLDDFRTPTGAKRATIEKLQFVSKNLDQDCLDGIATQVMGIAFARGLAEMPANEANPEGVVRTFQDAVKQAGVAKNLEIEVWDEKKIAKEGMGLLDAVAKGAKQPPRFLIARYGKHLPAKCPTLYLVGKGVCFDTGGINIKAIPYKELLAMKKDMAGAAGVLGAILSIARAQPSIRVVAVTPLCINAVGSNAVLPGDIVKSYSGKTVEIQNTDAEGRLILADALHFAVQNKADYIVDVATLTGACVVALGEHLSGVFTNKPEFQETVVVATSMAGEPTWPLPMSPRYGEELTSNLADLSNMGTGRSGGASLGAKFLENFVGNVPWCHLDIAGTDNLGAPAAAGAQVKASGRMASSLCVLSILLAHGTVKNRTHPRKKH